MINRKLYYINTIFIGLIAFFTGFVINLLISIMYDSLTDRFIRISFILAFFLSSGILLSFKICEMLSRRLPYAAILGISFLITLGVSSFGFLFILTIEPLWILGETRMFYMYAIMNLLYSLTVSVFNTGNTIYQQRIFETEKQVEEERSFKEQIELKMYASKINPHFLFNTLDMIISLTPDPEKTEHTLLDLSDLLRYSVRVSEKEQVTVGEELEIVRKYLSIQKQRFEERLDYSISVNVEAFLPPMLIQPIVENCIKHNINLEKNVSITIEAVLIKNVLTLSITDSCRKLEEKMLKKGHGLEITKKRVEISGGTFIIKDGGVRIRIPQNINKQV